MTNMLSSTHNQSAELVRGIAAFGIVGCHLALSPLTVGGKWALSFCDLNVAIFAALSGWFFSRKLYDPTVSRGELAVARIRRLLPIYVFWTICYLLAGLCFDLIFKGRPDAMYGEWQFWIGVVFQGRAACHLWFLIVLVCVQVALALLWPRRLSRWCVWVLTTICLFGANLYSGNWWTTYFLRLTAFCLLGIGLACFADDARHDGRWLVLGLICALIIHVLPRGQFLGWYRDALIVVSVLLLCSSYPVINPRLQDPIALLGASSLGVFLFHPMVTAMNGVWIRHVCVQPYGIVIILMDWVISWGLALLLALLSLQIPALRRLVQ